MLAICLFICLSVCQCTAERFSYIKDRAIWRQNLTEANDLAAFAGGSSCDLCYGGSRCWSADSFAARCEYLSETSALITEDDVEEEQGQGTGVRLEVDDAFGALMGKAAVDERFQDCIPHVSQYTNCHKGNICLGCTSCSCSSKGTWSCQQVQQCTSKQVQLDIEEEILNLAIEKLNAVYSNSRKKRSFQSRFEKPTNIDKKPSRSNVRVLDPTSTILSSENSERNEANRDKYTKRRSRVSKQSKPNEAQPISFLEKEFGLQHMTDDLFKEIKKNLSISSVIKVSKNKSDVELTFEDLLNDDVSHNHTLTYQPLFDSKTSTKSESIKTNYDVGDLFKIVNVIYNVKDIIANGGTTEKVHGKIESSTEARHTYAVVTSTTERATLENKSTEIPITSTSQSLALHVPAKTETNVTKSTESVRTLAEFDLNDDMNVNGDGTVNRNIMDNNFLSERDFKDYIDFEEIKPINVSKRDIDLNQLDNSPNTPQTLQSLNEDVLQPLNNIINEKQLEINDLKNVKERLLDYIKTFSNKNFTLNSNKTQLIEESKDFAIYHLAISPQNVENDTGAFSKNYNPSRRSGLNKTIQTKANQTLASKYLRKLKRDIYEILRDIIAIKKITNKEEPHDLKLLTRALKFYIRSQTKKDKQFSQDKELLNWWDTQKETRRVNTEFQEKTYVQDELRHIFLILDKDISQAVHVLSQHTRKVIQRVIHNLVTEGSEQTDKNDLHNNLTEKIATFVGRINTSLADIKNASVFDIVDKMKMLHLVLTSDADNLRNTLFVLNKYTNRRNQEQIELDKELEDALEIIKKEVDLTKKYISRMFVDVGTYNYIKSYGIGRPKSNGGRKREPFMRYLKKILGKSKKGVLGIIHRVTPPKDKNYELLTLNRLMEYEKVMKKWQTDLEVTPKREKRSQRRKMGDMASELKNILPKYLRGKVGTGIIARSKANRVNQRRYYVDRDNVFNINRNTNVQVGKHNARSTKLSKTSNTIVNRKTKYPAIATTIEQQVMENDNSIPNFLVMAPRKTGVRTKIAHEDLYPSLKNI